LPLAGGESLNTRKGTAFWEILEDHNVPATIFKIPANYPPSETGQKTLSGMGTPDIIGTLGVYTVYSDDSKYQYSDLRQNAKIRTVQIIDNQFTDFVFGPENSIIAGDVKPDTTLPLTVHIDPDNPIVKIVIGDKDDEPKEIILKQGEWSDFVSMDFEIVPMVVAVPGITKFYLKEVRPNFTLYCDPINISPESPIPDISTPASWASELYEKHGYFYTKGMPEATNALEDGVLTYDEYSVHSKMIQEKRKEIFFDMLADHKSGVLFYYFCSGDLDSHMMWRCMDKNHPTYDPNRGHEDFLQKLYQDFDNVVGKVMKEIDEKDTLIIMSDHGFAPFYRSFNINTWLLNNGFITLKLDPGANRDPEAKHFGEVDWQKTIAYAYGFTGIYINKKGRGPDSKTCVPLDQVDAIVNDLCAKLKKVTDPKTGEKLFYDVYKTRNEYSGVVASDAPEIVAGFNRGFRISNETAEGCMPMEEIQDNLKCWGGCHIMDPNVVPGVLFTNRKIIADNPHLVDLPVTILKEYNIEKLPDMEGRPVLSKK